MEMFKLFECITTFHEEEFKTDKNEAIKPNVMYSIPKNIFPIANGAIKINVATDRTPSLLNQLVRH